MEMSAAFFFTIPGPKMIWQFGELGYDYSINHCANGTINNNCRLDAKPIRWDYLAEYTTTGFMMFIAVLISFVIILGIKMYSSANNITIDQISWRSIQMVEIKISN